MEDPMPKPSFSTQISLGNLIQILLIVAAGVAGFQQIRSSTNANSILISATAEQVLELKETTTEAIKLAYEATKDIDDLTPRMRAVENQQARADERLTAILTLLNRIDSRLERIERSNP